MPIDIRLVGSSEPPVEGSWGAAFDLGDGYFAMSYGWRWIQDDFTDGKATMHVRLFRVTDTGLTKVGDFAHGLRVVADAYGRRELHGTFEAAATLPSGRAVVLASYGSDHQNLTVVRRAGTSLTFGPNVYLVTEPFQGWPNGGHNITDPDIPNPVYDDTVGYLVGPCRLVAGPGETVTVISPVGNYLYDRYNPRGYGLAMRTYQVNADDTLEPVAGWRYFRESEVGLQAAGADNYGWIEGGVASEANFVYVATDNWSSGDNRIAIHKIDMMNRTYVGSVLVYAAEDDYRVLAERMVLVGNGLLLHLVERQDDYSLLSRFFLVSRDLELVGSYTQPAVYDQSDRATNTAADPQASVLGGLPVIWHEDVSIH